MLNNEKIFSVGISTIFLCSRDLDNSNLKNKYLISFARE